MIRRSADAEMPRWLKGLLVGLLTGLTGALLGLFTVGLADTNLRYDREVKLPLYARYGIREVWIVDLENRCLHVFREPAEGGYKQVQTIERPEVIAPLQLPECGIDLSGLF